MGLITGLLTLPLAPIRGTVWLAEMLQAQAENATDEESALQATLAELELAREQGELSEEEIEEAENQLLDRLITIRGFGGEEGHGIQ
jgi:ribosomal protein L16 Arg81 hydroxylase